MKVVLFCGGFGMRLREYSEAIPKPMVKIGYRPILWHVMKYYAHFGHTDFILCLGWQANVIKEYFLTYDECLSNDFVLSAGGDSIKLLNKDINDWNITFVDTGMQANIGQRLKAVQPYLEGEETFLANYTDGLSDLPLPRMIDFHQQAGATATFLSVRPTHSFHTVTANAAGQVSKIQAIHEMDEWMNAGYFVLDQRIFDYLQEGDELVDQPFQRLVREGALSTLNYEGFFACMDTYKEMEILQNMHARGQTLWEVWNQSQIPTEHPGGCPGGHEQPAADFTRNLPR